MTPDPKKNLKKAIKTTSFGIDPQKAIHSELTDQTDHLEEMKDTLKQPLTVNVDSLPKEFSQHADAVKNAAGFINAFLKSVTEKGDKGDKGDTPQKGVDYLTEEEMNQIKEALTPILGKDYFTPEHLEQIVQEATRRARPTKGIDYKDGEPGKPLKFEDLTPEQKLELRGDKGEPGIRGPIGFAANGRDGKNAELPKMEELAKEIVKALRKLPEKDKLDISSLRNSAQIQSAIGKMNSMKAGSGFKFNGKDYKFEELMHGGGGGSSVTVTFNYESPLTGTLGTDSVYTFAHSIGQLILNSQVQDPNLDYSGKGTTTATFLNGFIPTGTSLLNVYLS